MAEHSFYAPVRVGLTTPAGVIGFFEGGWQGSRHLAIRYMRFEAWLPRHTIMAILNRLCLRDAVWERIGAESQGAIRREDDIFFDAGCDFGDAPKSWPVVSLISRGDRQQFLVDMVPELADAPILQYARMLAREKGYALTVVAGRGPRFAGTVAHWEQSMAQYKEERDAYQRSEGSLREQMRLLAEEARGASQGYQKETALICNFIATELRAISKMWFPWRRARARLRLIFDIRRKLAG